jgi:hypothetical protein
MSFRVDAFYLIEPRPGLRPHLVGRVDADFASILLDCVLIRNQEGGRTIWTSESHAAKVKLLYVARLREYDPLIADADAERVLGISRVDTEIFDKWWSMRRFVVEEDAAKIEEFIRLVKNKVDVPQDGLVAHWFAKLLESQKPPNPTEAARSGRPQPQRPGNSAE